MIVNRSMASDVTYKEIWDTLSKINVNEHTQKKKGGKFQPTYLSWTWAWTTLMEHYPQAEFEFQPSEVHDDDTVTAHVTITIGDCKRSCWLPVMDNRFNAQPNPTARDISDTKMRCLVKCIAIFGLGLYIFAGEDIPADDEPKAKAKVKVKPGADVPENNMLKKYEGVITGFTTFIGDCKNREELKDFWQKNKDEMGRLERQQPEVFDVVMKSFKERGASL